MKKVAFLTFGCKLNFSETSSIAKTFLNDGFSSVDFKNKADLYVINSCSVTGNAEKKCKTAIKQAHKRNPKAHIAVIGCFSQLRPNELAVFDGVDLVLGNKEKFSLLKHFKKFESTGLTYPIIETSNLNKNFDFHPSYSSGDRTRSFLKVQDGCDYYCTFCTIPHARGRSRSGNIESTLTIAKEIAKTVINEIILTGVNVGDFGKQSNEKLIDFLKELDKIEGIERIRISSIEPDLLTHEIIEFIALSKKFLPHFHIPLQSGSNEILKEMKRKYNRELFADRVTKIKSLIPDCMIAADVIVGFPGESEEQFMDTYEFIKNIDITYTHVFSYSDRPGTIASKIQNKVPANIIKERSRKLHKLSDRKKQKFYIENKGNIYNVLFESDNDNGFMHGFTENYIRVKLPYNTEFINKIAKVKLLQLEMDGVFTVELITRGDTLLF
jgi:threonylcarbamoyladenosine tRNA methylthiotransferase MtaB